jgi:hypothetical protein
MTPDSSLRSRLAGLVALALGASFDARAQETVPAVIPVEVLAVDAALATGSIISSSWKMTRPTVARQPARAARAVVLEGSGKAKVLARA